MYAAMEYKRTWQKETLGRKFNAVSKRKSRFLI